MTSDGFGKRKKRLRMFDTHPNKRHEFPDNAKVCKYCKVTKEDYDWLQLNKNDIIKEIFQQ